MMRGKLSNPGTIPKKIMKSGQAPEKGPGRHRKRVRSGTRKGSGQASEKVEFGKVSEK